MDWADIDFGRLSPAPPRLALAGGALLARVKLDHRASDYPDQLSTGQQQRVAIVRDLAPEVMTMVLATHEMQFAREVSDLVVFLEKGTLLEKGPPQQIFGDPKEARTRQFLKQIIEAGRL